MICSVCLPVFFGKVGIDKSDGFKSVKLPSASALNERLTSRQLHLVQDKIDHTRILILRGVDVPKVWFKTLLGNARILQVFGSSTLPFSAIISFDWLTAQPIPQELINDEDLYQD